MNTNLEQKWNELLSLIKERISKPSFETWFKDTTLESLNHQTIVIGVPNSFIQDHLENFYKNLLEELLFEQTGEMFTCRFQLHSNKEKGYTNEGQKGGNVGLEALAQEQTQLISRYTFETFVIGEGNRFAHAASLAVAEAPAKAYNPLFLYGGVGLGKTHLLHAIAHYVLQHYPLLRVVYMTSERFTNEFIHAVRDGKAAEFRTKYRNIDVLLIDDIQFLAGKEQTQEEFFHTFNALHEANKQIVISSDRHPKEIPTLEDRLRSRFEWGLITDIQPPDYETRMAILHKKARAENLDIPNDVISYMATHINTNIRELEGALIRVVAYSSLINQDIDLEMAKEALKDIIHKQRPRTITIQDIQHVVSEYYGLHVEEMKAKKRTKNVSFPRQIAMYLSREMTDHSLPKIGSEFGGRDHTTVLHAYEKIRQQLQMDLSLQESIRQIKERLKQLQMSS